MSCTHCNATLQPGQQFCIQCGAPVPSQTQLPPPTPLSSAPPTATGPATFTIVEQTLPTPFEPDNWGPAPTTTTTAAAGTSVVRQVAPLPPPSTQHTQVQQAVPPTSRPPGSRTTPVSRTGGAVFAVFASLAGLTAIVGSFLPVLTVKTDAPISPVGDFGLNDILAGTNLQVAFAIAGVALLIGAIVANLGLRFGAGLGGGAALTLVPYLAAVWGRTMVLSDQAEAAARGAVAGGAGGTYIQTSPGTGIFVLLAAAVLGLVALFVGFAVSSHDSSPPLNRLACFGGAVATLAAAAGPLIPLNGSSFSDNFNTDASSAWLVYSRLGILAVVAICGLIGFLRCNRWGIGFAIGGVVMFAWQWVSSITELGDQPYPPAFQNPGGDFKPYIVTTIGVVAMVSFAVLAMVVGGTKTTSPPPTTLTTPDYRQAT